jgi:hypothetical protein
MRWGLIVGLAALVACGGGGDDDGTTPRPDAVAAADAAIVLDAGTPDAEPVPYCYLACGTAADCVVTKFPFASEDNYRCNAGACEYTGCLSDDECAPSACRSFFGLTAQCVPRCTTAADCAGGTDPVQGEDNYQCVDGACKWLGCTSDAECVEQRGAGWECFANRESPIPGCWQRCDASRACDPGSTCLNHVCEVVCTSNEDCRSWGDGEWVCR